MKFTRASFFLETDKFISCWLKIRHYSNYNKRNNFGLRSKKTNDFKISKTTNKIGTANHPSNSANTDMNQIQLTSKNKVCVEER